MIWFTDGKNKVGIEMCEIDKDGNHLPDWTEDFFGLASTGATYDDETYEYRMNDSFILEDMIKAAEEWENYEDEDECSKEYDKARGYGRFVKITREGAKTKMTNNIEEINTERYGILESLVEDLMIEKFDRKNEVEITHTEIRKKCVDGKLIGIIEYVQDRLPEVTWCAIYTISPDDGISQLDGFALTMEKQNGLYDLWWDTEEDMVLQECNLRQWYMDCLEVSSELDYVCFRDFVKREEENGKLIKI